MCQQAAPMYTSSKSMQQHNLCACKQLRSGTLHKGTGDVVTPHFGIEALQIVLSHEATVKPAGSISKFYKTKSRTFTRTMQK